MSDFRSLLDAEVTEVDRPKPLPAGNYVYNVGEYELKKSAKKGTDFVSITLTPVSAQEDVDAAELAACLGEKSLSDKPTKVDFYLTPDAVWRLDEFLIERLGIEGTMSRSARLEQMAGKQVVGQVSHVPSQRDENVVYANITAFAKYDG